MHVRHVVAGRADPALLDARRRLADRTAARIDAAGRLAAPCRSRVLETALALRLLDLTGHTRERDHLARFLGGVTRLEPASTLDRALAECALAGTPLPEAMVRSALAGFDHFTAGRKRNLLHAIAVVFGEPGTELTVQPHDRGALHPWASAVATASEVIIAGRATPTQREELVSALAHPGIWEGHLLCHLLAAHAVRRLDGTDEVVAGAVRHLLATRRPDGGIPFIEGLDVFCSALAGLGLAATGDQPVRAIADRLAGLQDPHTGGWGYATGVRQSDVDTTSVVLELLVAAGDVRYAGPIAKGSAYLHDIRGVDGGFPTYLRGAPSEVAMTAAAANAIELNDTGHETLRAAAGFIARKQRADGSFEPGWSRSTANTLCRTLLALHRAATALPDEQATIQPAIARSGHRLVSDQNDDGGWGQTPGEPSDPISTSFALIGLARHPAGSFAVPAGLRYLLSCQRADGGFVSRPDSTGPRGFVYDVPALADLYPLLALSHVAAATHLLQAG